MSEQLHSIDELLARNDTKKAEILIAKSLRMEISASDRAGLLFRRARARLLSGRPDDALSDINSISAIMSSEFQTSTLLELLGDCYFARFELASVGFADRSDIQHAQQTYEQIIQDFPRFANLGWIYYQLGRIWVISNNTEAAIKCFQQGLLNSSHLSALTAYCYERLAFVAFYEQRDLEMGLNFVNRAIDTYPATATRNWLIQAFLLKSRILRRMQDYEGALAAAQTTLSLVSKSGENKPTLSEVLLTIGELLAELEHRDKEVLSVLQQFIQVAKKPLGVDVTWSRVNEMLGNAYFNLRQYESAIAAYNAVLQFNPDHPWGLSLFYRIARCYYEQRSYDDVIKTVYQMMELANTEDQSINDYRVYDILGNAQFALGRYEKAVDAYRTALEMVPPNAENLSQIKSYYELARERI